MNEDHKSTPRQLLVMEATLDARTHDDHPAGARPQEANKIDERNTTVLPACAPHTNTDEQATWQTRGQPEATIITVMEHIVKERQRGSTADNCKHTLDMAVLMESVAQLSSIMCVDWLTALRLPLTASETETQSRDPHVFVSEFSAHVLLRKNDHTAQDVEPQNEMHGIRV